MVVVGDIVVVVVVVVVGAKVVVVVVVVVGTKTLVDPENVKLELIIVDLYKVSVCVVVVSSLYPVKFKCIVVTSGKSGYK